MCRAHGLGHMTRVCVDVVKLSGVASVRVTAGRLVACCRNSANERSAALSCLLPAAAWRAGTGQRWEEVATRKSATRRRYPSDDAERSDPQSSLQAQHRHSPDPPLHSSSLGLSRFCCDGPALEREGQRIVILRRSAWPVASPAFSRMLEANVNCNCQGQAQRNFDSILCMHASFDGA